MMVGLRLAPGRDHDAETSSRRGGDKVARILARVRSVESTQASQRRGVPGRLGTSCHVAYGDSVRRQSAETPRVNHWARGAGGRAWRRLHAPALAVGMTACVVRARGFCCAPSAQRRSCVLWRIRCSARLGVGRHSSSDQISLWLMRRFGQGVLFAALVAGRPPASGSGPCAKVTGGSFLGFGWCSGRFAEFSWGVVFGVA